MADPKYTFPDKVAATKVGAPKPPSSNVATLDPIAPTGRSVSDITAPVAPPQPTATEGRSFSDLLKPEQREKTAGQAMDVISGQLGAKAEPSLSDTLARNQFQKAAGEATRQVKEQGALGGRVATGQMTGDLSQHLQQNILPARMDFEARLASDAENRASAEKNQGIQNLMGMEGLNQQDRALAQDASQFDSQMAWQKYALEKGIDADTAARAWQSAENEKSRQSQENIAYAGLNLEEKALAQEASQFTDQMEWQRYALDKGIDADTAARVWQSSENEKQRSFQAGESELDRGLQQMLTELGLDLNYAQLGEQVRQFDSRLDFDEWATKTGLEENEKNRIHDLRVQEIQNKFATGERLDSQDFQYLMEDKKIQAQRNLMEIESLLNLDTMAKQNQYDTIMLGLQNKYAEASQQSGFNHDIAMTNLTNEYTKQLTEMGYSHEEALQAASIKAAEINQRREHEFMKAQSIAQMAQEDEFFFEELGLKREQLDASIQQFKDDLGFREEVWESGQVNEALERAAITMELAGDNNDMMDMAAEMFMKSIASDMGWDEDQTANAIKAMTEDNVVDDENPVVDEPVEELSDADFENNMKNEDYVKREIDNGTIPKLEQANLLNPEHIEELYKGDSRGYFVLNNELLRISKNGDMITYDVTPNKGYKFTGSQFRYDDNGAQRDGGTLILSGPNEGNIFLYDGTTIPLSEWTPNSQPEAKARWNESQG